MNKQLNAFRRDAETYRKYVLAELRLAHKRAVLLREEIEHIGKTLADNLIDCDTALAWLADAKALEFLRPIAPDSLKDDPEAAAKAREVFDAAKSVMLSEELQQGDDDAG